MNVQVTETNLFGEYLYRVWVDYQKFDKFFSKTPLTKAEMRDVEALYLEGLTGRDLPDRLSS